MSKFCIAYKQTKMYNVAQSFKLHSLISPDLSLISLFLSEGARLGTPQFETLARGWGTFHPKAEF